ncbi:uncharacterized protein [Lepeophtheirus salmonis]|uniref:uncharacterized protein isoform X2 n=1 Tax=Lepeophtheirus salmonis TaxID=72036 RepID=UPI003AF33189
MIEMIKEWRIFILFLGSLPTIASTSGGRFEMFKSLIKKHTSENKNPEKNEVCDSKFGAMEDMIEFKRMAIYEPQKEIISIDFNLRKKEKWDFYYQLITESETCKNLCDDLIPKACPSTSKIKNHIYPGCCDINGCKCYCYYECSTLMDYLTRLEELLPTPYFDKCVTNATTAEVNVWLKKACYGAKTLYKKKRRKCKKLAKKDGSSSKVTCRNAGKCVKAPGILCKACIKFACEGENDIQKFDLMETKEDCVIRKKCRKKRCRRKKKCSQECDEDEECTKVCKTIKKCRKRKCRKVKKCY